MKISVVIPVFNSEQTISDVTVGVRRALSENNIDHEIILVDDGSKDNSWNVLKDLSTIDTNIITIKLLKNYGQ
jgi:glycosyltransferase involved in cell wall biosynthesis